VLVRPLLGKDPVARVALAHEMLKLARELDADMFGSNLGAFDLLVRGIITI
jgi:hypothetical protein